MAPEEVGPSVTPPAVGRLHWVLIPGPNMASPLVQGITGALGPGISQRAAAARSQRLWRWLVKGEIYEKEHKKYS